ncbi:MAG TPA: phosphate ABC transporter substrate-binding protein [Candidatus Dormibacteraeota bacterium]|nr:phosphate ABC transporter substrate-binding protein [Candidatus Dormibacteraeota bacterium]
MTLTLPKRAVGLAMAGALLVAACSSGSTPSPSADNSSPSAAASTAASPSSAGSAAASGGAVNCVSGSITAGGSTAMQPLVDAAAKAYDAACSGATISVQGGGSGTGLNQVFAGAFQIGDSDVAAEEKLKPDQASALVDHKVVKQAWIMVVSNDVTGVTNLTTQQTLDIWTGKITNWKDVGGPDKPIVLILRPASSGTRAVFKKIVLGGANEATGQALTEDSNGAVVKAVGATPGSTSVIGLAYYQQNKTTVIGLQLDGVDATIDNMVSGAYKLSAYGHMYTKGQPDGLAKAFLDFMYSDQVQKQIEPGLFFAPVPAGS